MGELQQKLAAAATQALCKHMMSKNVHTLSSGGPQVSMFM
jgi:hypothetical protein